MGMRELDLRLGKHFLEINDPNNSREICTNGLIMSQDKEKTMTKTSIKTFKNEYDVTMLEIKEEKRRPLFISEKKVLAILATNDDASELKPVVKHGRDLFQVAHLEGDRSFTIGEKKIRVVLDNAEGINSVLSE